MMAKHAAIAGASVGILSGIAICTVIDASLSDTLFRSAILAVGGGWMGVLLVWLNELLTPSHGDRLSHGRRGHRL